MALIMDIDFISIPELRPHPNPYVGMMEEYKGFAFSPLEAKSNRGKWKSLFKNSNAPLDLEIGCGNGFFFEHRSVGCPDRNLLGIEAKYKPLIQSVRRVRKLGLENAKGLRVQAEDISEIFAPGELSTIMIFFPDPWPKKRQQKNRLLKTEFFRELQVLQKAGEKIEIKTDSQDYFQFILEQIPLDCFEVTRSTTDLHKSEWAKENFVTGFERIFIKQGLPICYLQLTNRKL